jgi:8-oxo-dGTP pyrophosphatase MutT (NUDIX family)
VWGVAGTLGWAESYLGKLRAQVGEGDVLLFVGARCVLRDEHGRVLLIRRSDNGYWALPAGAMELGESVAENAAREVFEETGLTATALTPFAIYSGLAHTHTNMYGHTYQLHITAFRIDAWTGELLTETDETTDAGWYPPAALPGPVSSSVLRSLADLAEFEATGRLVFG